MLLPPGANSSGRLFSSYGACMRCFLAALVLPLFVSTISGCSPHDVKLSQGDAKDLQAMVDGHKGEVVFVDFWATWCGPCVEGFPHTVELSQKYKDQGLATIAVCFDELKDEARVRQFLVEKNAHFQHLLSKYDGVS